VLQTTFYAIHKVKYRTSCRKQIDRFPCKDDDLFCAPQILKYRRLFFLPLHVAPLVANHQYVCVRCLCQSISISFLTDMFASASKSDYLVDSDLRFNFEKAFRESITTDSS